MIDYVKEYAFNQYIRWCALIDYNSGKKNRQHFVPYLRRKTERLVEKYPDFVSAYEQYLDWKRG